MPPRSPGSEHISKRRLRGGLRDLLADGVLSQMMDAVTSGAFLTAFALMLGANNIIIGLIAAIAPATQVLQIPAIYLVQRLGKRRALVVVGSLISRAFWLVIAALPWLVPGSAALPLLLLCLVGYFGLAAVSSCAYNSWVRDLVPERLMGRYFARRTAWSMAAGAGLSLLASMLVDKGGRPHMHDHAGYYSVLFATGAALGLLAVWFLSRMPEPPMAEARESNLWRQLLQPVRQKNFRRLLAFTGVWTFAVNLSGPFFVVFMLKTVELRMSTIILLTVLSQFATFALLRVWGRLADRFSNKSTLSVAGLMLAGSYVLWLFVTDPGYFWLSIPLLILIHALTGIANAGVTLCSGNLALKIAPRGEATSYLAANALMAGVMGTVAPMLGGVLAHLLEPEQVQLLFRWINAADTPALPSFEEKPLFTLQGMKFLFLISFLISLYALHRLALVRESGEAGRERVLAELYQQAGQAVRGLPGMFALIGAAQGTFALFRRKRRGTARSRPRRG